MAIDIEHLKHFQSEQLEQKNIQTSARLPIHTRTSEWALIEIVILLTRISGDSKTSVVRCTGCWLSWNCTDSWPGYSSIDSHVSC